MPGKAETPALRWRTVTLKDGSTVRIAVVKREKAPK